MIVLDTNIISAVTAERPDPVIINWLNAQSPSELFTSTVTVFELWIGVEGLPPGRRRDELGHRTAQMLSVLFVQPPLVLSEQAARLAAALMGRRRRAGIVVDHRDTMIAGICLAHGATLATRNIRHFADAGLVLIDPWGEAAGT